MRILMLAIHRSLIKYEAELFCSLGHDVCSVHDLWTSYQDTPGQIYPTPPKEPLPPWHSRHLRPLAISPKDIETLKGIDLSLASFGRAAVSSNDIIEAIDKNFDAIYVQMVPAWLFSYARSALAHGKRVFLRVFGHPFSELGHTHINNITEVSKLSQFSNLTFVPVLETERGMWGWWKGHLAPAFAALDGKILKGYVNQACAKGGLLSVQGYFDKETWPGINRMGVPWTNIDFTKQHISDKEMAVAMSSARAFVDLYSGPNIVKYSSLEAIAMGLPCFIPRNSGHAKEMLLDGVDVSSFSYDNRENFYAILESCFHDGQKLGMIANIQNSWLAQKQDATRDRWRSLLS